MKPRITPQDREVKLSDDDVIVSKTDLTGRITYANRTFMRIAGYSELQLVGVQHNIIRHPDMPRGAFRLLWQTVERGEEFFAYVKNLTADGSYYWVFANVTPDYDLNGRMVGYFSVRRRPRPEAVEVMEGIYAQMLQVERASVMGRAPDASIEWVQGVLAEKRVSYEEFILSI